MTQRSTSKREPATSAPFTKYILQAVTAGHSTIVVADERPTMEWVKDACGEGTHTLFNGEGKVLRRFTVSTNRNGNLKIVGHTPEGLEGISTLNLHRLVKQYVRIVKVWPAKLADTRALAKELNRREALLEEALGAAEKQIVSISGNDIDDEALAALALAVEESRVARGVKVSA